MKVRILGAQNIEASDAGFTCIIIDDALVVDAGALTSSLSIEEQLKLKAVFLTHAHYDHIRDIPAIGMNYSLKEKSLDIYAAAPTREALTTHFINGVVYPDFTRNPKGQPALRLNAIEPGEKVNVGGYEVLSVPVNHALPATGYQVTSPDGKKVFITSDTGPGLAEAWRQVSPDLLIAEMTLPNRREDFARLVGHLTPAFLQQELESFKEIHHYLPEVVLIHVIPFDKEEIAAEIRTVEKALHIKIRFSHKGMTVNL